MYDVFIVSLFFKLIPNIILHINQEEARLSTAEILITVCNKHEMHNLIAKTETRESPLNITITLPKESDPPQVKVGRQCLSKHSFEWEGETERPRKTMCSSEATKLLQIRDNFFIVEE